MLGFFSEIIWLIELMQVIPEEFTCNAAYIVEQKMPKQLAPSLCSVLHVREHHADLLEKYLSSSYH